MDIYVELYHHIVSRESRRKMAQVMTDLIYKRPRIDFSEPYFTSAYHYECAIMRSRAELMRTLINKQVRNLFNLILMMIYIEVNFN